MLQFKFHHLFAFSLLLTTSWAQSAQAMAVNFDLAAATVTPQPPASTAGNADEKEKPEIPLAHRSDPLPVPAAASRPPIRMSQTSRSLPLNVIASSRVLTPPPLEALPASRILAPQTIAQASTNATDVQEIGISFAREEKTVAPASVSPVRASATLQAEFPAWIYEGDSDSLVARVIGSAEGTRAANGTPTRAYYGHTDPGNGVWNIGTFSYQHGAASPKEADSKQLKRLKRQGKAIAHQADRASLEVTLGEMLNGLDLANQAPEAALESGGYVDRLTQAKQKGMKNSEAIVWARTYSYIDPSTQRWNAPGLGNTLQSIKRDQRRRHDAVERAFHAYQAQNDLSNSSIASLDLTQQPPADLSVTSPLIAEGVETEKTDSIVATRPLADSLDFEISKPLPVKQQPTRPSEETAKATAELPQATTEVSSTENRSQENSLFEPQPIQSPG